MRAISLLLVGLIFGLGSVSADDTPLADKMSEVNKALKGLRRAKDDYGKCVEIVQNAQSLLLECFQWTPAMLSDVPEGKEKSEALASYKKKLAESYVALCELELAYLSEDVDKIDDANDLVKKAKKYGHDEFIEED